MESAESREQAGQRNLVISCINAMTVWLEENDKMNFVLRGSRLQLERKHVSLSLIEI